MPRGHVTLLPRSKLVCVRVGLRRVCASKRVRLSARSPVRFRESEGARPLQSEHGNPWCTQRLGMPLEALSTRRRKRRVRRIHLASSPNMVRHGSQFKKMFASKRGIGDVADVKDVIQNMHCGHLQRTPCHICKFRQIIQLQFGERTGHGLSCFMLHLFLGHK